MKLYEYEAKKIFSDNGIPIPKGEVASTVEEAKEIFKVIQPAVIKAQVLIGGRGKAGGIKLVDNEKDLEEEAKKLLESEIRGFKVRKLLIEEQVKIQKELYVAVTIEKSLGKAIILTSAKGGVDIEELAHTSPADIHRTLVDMRKGIATHEAIDIASQLGLTGKQLTQFQKIIKALYSIFTSYDAEIVEINPLFLTEDGALLAGDAKVNVDDEALIRHPEIRKEDEFLTDLEKEARKHNLGYVEMDGNIGVIGNGAGLNMTTLDILRYFGGEPANFLEVSGRTYHKAEQAIEIVLKNPNVKAIFGNFFGSISRCDVIAKGIAQAIENGKLSKDIVISMRGNGAEEGKKILANYGINCFENDKIAAEKVTELVKEGN